VTNNWDVVNQAIRAERARRKWSQEHLATISGVSLGTVKNLEGARQYKRPPIGALQDLDRAFGWPVGSLEEKLRGEGSPGPDPDYRIETTNADGEGDLVALVHSTVFEAIIAVAPDTTAERIREVEKIALDAAQRAGFGPPRRRLPAHSEDDPAS